MPRLSEKLVFKVNKFAFLRTCACVFNELYVYVCRYRPNAVLCQSTVMFISYYTGITFFFYIHQTNLFWHLPVHLIILHFYLINQINFNKNCRDVQCPL